ncbi:MAG: DUF2721 domain-containing protein [Spirochaetaceae bacterium]|nr:MAG: DUF2721 domain-containing protein [Spirochaetaceae bacterium]
MELQLSTPALLFPAISLLFLSYTNRFISYASLVRGLHEGWQHQKSPAIQAQIGNLRRRLLLIRHMQIAGAASLLVCVGSMMALFLGAVLVGEVLFGASLILMLLSLALLIRELQISLDAIDVQLKDMQE